MRAKGATDMTSLVDALPAGDPLREALLAARADTPDRPRLDRVYGAILGAGGPGGGSADGGGQGPDLPPPIVLPPSAPLPVAAGGAVAATFGAKTFGATALGKILGLALVGSASIATAVWIAGSTLSRGEGPSSRPAIATAAAPADDAPQPSGPSPTPRGDANALLDAPSEATTVAPSSRAPATGPAPTDEAAGGDVEMALLREAQVSAANAPARALELLDDSERRFPRSALSQERVVIRVQALLAAGRRDEALARARALLDANPGTAHRPRLEQLLPELAR